jgi:hypothetical protein
MQSPRSFVVFMSDGLVDTQAQGLTQRMGTTLLGLIADAELLTSAICFDARGVKLAGEGPPTLETSQALESRGVRLVV